MCEQLLSAMTQAVRGREDVAVVRLVLLAGGVGTRMGAGNEFVGAVETANLSREPISAPSGKL